DLARIFTGMNVTGTNIPANDTVAAIVPSFTSSSLTNATGQVTVTNFANLTNITAGMLVTGTGIPAGAKVASVVSTFTSSSLTNATGQFTLSGFTDTDRNKITPGMLVTSTVPASSVPAGTTVATVVPSFASGTVTNNSGQSLVSGFSDAEI